MVVQVLLNENAHVSGLTPPLVVDGDPGGQTLQAIVGFQREVVGVSQPDGRIDPGGSTLAMLVAGRRGIDLPAGGLCHPLLSGERDSYRAGMGRFGWGRSGGRLHGGCDIYAPVGTEIHALADGSVVQGYPFYLGTRALEIDHGEFLARYGEIEREAEGLSGGSEVKKGDVIGVVGQLDGLPFSMLHLELYGKTKEGPLTDRENLPFKRRSDLIDPTALLDRAHPLL